MTDPHELLHTAAHLAKQFPSKLIHRLQARAVLSRLKSLMPDSKINISVSDPISAMVIASLDFLSTPAGQQLVTDLRSVIVDLINHVHSHLPKPATP